jgi:hypothetical protein
VASVACTTFAVPPGARPGDARSGMDNEGMVRNADGWGPHRQDDDDVIEGLDGDTVDPSLIIPGGRRARRGRATFSATDFKNMPAGSDSD